MLKTSNFIVFLLKKHSKIKTNKIKSKQLKKGTIIVVIKNI